MIVIRKRYSVAFWLVGAFLVASIIGNTVTVKANTYNLYSTSCLGGWENTNLAVGKPDVSPESPLYNEGNSARLSGNAHAQIYCGGFYGDVIENTVPKKISVKFSWAVEYPNFGVNNSDSSTEEVYSSDIISEDQTESETLKTSEPQEKDLEMSLVEGDSLDIGEVQGESIESYDEDEIVSGTEDFSKSEESQNEIVEVKDDESTLDSDNGGTSLPSDIEENLAVPPEQSESVSGTELQPESDVASDPISKKDFMPWYITMFASIANAQGVEEENTNTQESTDFEESSGVIIELEDNAENDANNNIATSTNNSVDNTAKFLDAPSGLVEVFYTLDGIDWKSMGYVGSDEFQGKYFEIPIEEASSWEDISKIQISVQSTSIIDVRIPTLYLDSIWIEVDYELGEVQKLDGPHVYDKDVIIDPQAKHSCAVNPSSLSLQYGTDYKAIVSLAFSGDPSPTLETVNGDQNENTDENNEQSPKRTRFGFIDIGALPRGIDVRFFSTTTPYSYLIDEYGPDNIEINVSIYTQDAQRGSFSIPFIFTKTKGKDSSTICQLNLIYSQSDTVINHEVVPTESINYSDIPGDVFFEDVSRENDTGREDLKQEIIEEENQAAIIDHDL